MCGEDYAAPAYDYPFGELVWVVHGGDFVASAYQYMTWTVPTTLPNTEEWSDLPDANGQVMPGWEALPHITCNWFGSNSLISLFNGTPRVSGAYSSNFVLTFFDENTVIADPGKMGFTDATGNTSGFDDFQDGWGCGDDWQPKAQRGDSSFIMVR